MDIKEIDEAKNAFVKWLIKHEATELEEYEGKHDWCWDYYRTVDAFIGNVIHTACFQMYSGRVKISYNDTKSVNGNLSIKEFLKLIQ